MAPCRGWVKSSTGEIQVTHSKQEQKGVRRVYAHNFDTILLGVREFHTILLGVREFRKPKREQGDAYTIREVLVL